MKDFAAIDFETANFNRSSVCSVGIVIVRNGQLFDTFYELIRPNPNYFSPQNTLVHGLTRMDTDSAERFPEVWDKIETKIDGLPLVAHNSPFDSSCLRAVCQLYKMEYPDYQFFCTLKASRQKLSFLPNHKLPTVARYCGFDLTQHHNALADAEACAHIAMQLL